MAKKIVNAYTDHKTSEIYDTNGPPIPLEDFIARLQAIETQMLQSGWD
jgi:hypothetical protein